MHCFLGALGKCIQVYTFYNFIHCYKSFSQIFSMFSIFRANFSILCYFINFGCKVQASSVKIIYITSRNIFFSQYLLNSFQQFSSVQMVRYSIYECYLYHLQSIPPPIIGCGVYAGTHTNNISLLENTLQPHLFPAYYLLLFIDVP